MFRRIKSRRCNSAPALLMYISQNVSRFIFRFLLVFICFFFVLVLGASTNGSRSTVPVPSIQVISEADWRRTFVYMYINY